MAEDNTLSIVAVIISIIAVVVAGFVLVNQPTEKEVNLTPLYDSTQANDFAISKLNIELAKTPGLISSSNSQLTSYINQQINGIKLRNSDFDDDDIEDIEDALDKLDDDIDDLEDIISCMQSCATLVCVQDC